MHLQSQKKHITNFSHTQIDALVNYVFDEINKDIVKDRLEQVSYHAQIMSLLSDLNSIPINAFSFSNINNLFFRLRRLDTDAQHTARPLLEFALASGKSLIKKDITKINTMKLDINLAVSIHHLASALNSLTKLSVDWQKQADFLNDIFIKLKMYCEAYERLPKASHDAELLRSYAFILGAAINLPVNRAQYPGLLNLLFARFTMNSLRELEHDGLNSLWQFIVYTDKHRTGSHAERNMLISIENKLKGLQEPKPEQKDHSLQVRLTQAIRSVLSDSVLSEMCTEYPIGPYRADIAFPEIKVIIEINGPCHYRGKILRRQDQFRAFILEKWDGWKTINIAYFEVEENQNRLSDFLIEKLNAYAPLLVQETFKQKPEELLVKLSLAPTRHVK